MEQRLSGTRPSTTERDEIGEEGGPARAASVEDRDAATKGSVSNALPCGGAIQPLAMQLQTGDEREAKAQQRWPERSHNVLFAAPPSSFSTNGYGEVEAEG